MLTERFNLWKPEYSLDIDIIDTQHKGFFDICSESIYLHERAKMDDMQPSDIIMILYKFRCYAFQHFFTEESLMIKYHYPSIFAHSSVHDIFLEKLRGFTQELHEISTNKVATKESLCLILEHINTYTLSWGSNHVLSQDKQYVQYFKT